MSRKTFTAPLELKAEKAGAFRAVFCTFDVVDHDGDLVKRSAFQDVERSGRKVPLEGWNHDYGLPVGHARVKTTEREAIAEGQFLLDTGPGRDTYETVKALGDTEWSFTYDVIRSEPGTVAGKQVRILTALDLWGISPVTRGASIGTRVLSLKERRGSGTGMDPTDALMEVSLLDAWNRIHHGDGRMTPAGIEAKAAALQGPEAVQELAAVLESPSATIEYLQDLAAKADSGPVTNLELLRARMAGIDGGGHSDAWVDVMTGGEIRNLIDQVEARNHIARGEATARVAHWLQSPAQSQ